MKSKIGIVIVFGVFVVAMVCGGCRRSVSPKVIVCIGNSLTVCGGKGGRYTDWLGEWLKGHTIINKGVNGDTLAQGRARFERDVLALNADVVVIELGANDFWQMRRNISELQADLEDMVGRARGAGMEVDIASCFGEREYEIGETMEFEVYRYNFAQAIAKMEQAVATKYDCFYVPNMQADIKPNGREPYWADKNHPNKQGNEFVARRILKELKKAIRRAGVHRPADDAGSSIRKNQAATQSQ